jgi:hypothetical protein
VACTGPEPEVVDGEILGERDLLERVGREPDQRIRAEHLARDRNGTIVLAEVHARATCIRSPPHCRR